MAGDGPGFRKNFFKHQFRIVREPETSVLGQNCSGSGRLRRESRPRAVVTLSTQRVTLGGFEQLSRAGEAL